MKRELIAKLHRMLEELVHKEVQTGTEFWLARDLQQVLGYKRWPNFTRDGRFPAHDHDQSQGLRQRDY